MVRVRFVQGRKEKSRKTGGWEVNRKSKAFICCVLELVSEEFFKKAVGIGAS